MILYDVKNIKRLSEAFSRLMSIVISYEYDNNYLSISKSINFIIHFL